MFDNHNNNEDEEENRLLKDAAKKAIPQKIKGLSPQKLLIIGAIIAIAFLFLFVFIVLMIPSWLLLFDDDDDNGNVSETSNLSYIDSNNEGNYWWPLGGSTIETKDGVEYATGEPVSLRITSEFGYRVIDGKSSNHSGIDIGSSGGKDYVIAAMKGTVVSVNNSCDNNGYYGNPCGGSYGNYVVIEHSDGVYTRYAHLYQNSIRVNVGDNVNQGQIIAEMGNSGSSTGKHLHFEVNNGGIGTSYAVNPLDYISVEDPRPISTVNNNVEFLNMLHEMEGSGPIDGDNYVVYADSGGYLTVGHGVALKFHSDKFANHGININNLHEGSKLPRTMVNSIENEILMEMRNSVKNTLSSNYITLEPYQEDALVLRIYNVGNIDAFPANYKQYGETQALYDNYMSKPNTSNGKYLQGLANRRYKEWILFSQGIYTYNKEG